MAKNIAVDQDMTLRRKWLLKKFIRYYRKNLLMEASRRPSQDLLFLSLDSKWVFSEKMTF